MIDLYESVVPMRKTDFMKKDVDDVVEKLLPDEERCFPIRCRGDGNCLYNSISPLICGNYDLVLELRLKTAREILTNGDFYDIDILNKYSGYSKNIEEEIIKTLV